MDFGLSENMYEELAEGQNDAERKNILRSITTARGYFVCHVN